MTTKIKPCPFCGWEKPELDSPHNKGTGWVVCRGCGTEGPVGDNEQDAIDRWNRRGADADAVMVTEAEFQIKPFYESLTDSMLIYFKDVRSHAKRVDEQLTLFLAIGSDEIIGCEIKGVRLMTMPRCASEGESS